MTVPSTARRAGPFLGNGSTTTFSFSFKTFAAGDLQVVKTSTIGVESVLVLASDYTVSLNPDQDASPGGTITYPISGVALATGEKLTVLSQLAYEQTTDLLGGGAFNARVIEDTFDRTVIQIQQLEERLDRCVVIPASASASALLPTPAPFEVIGWDANGTALVNVDPSDFLTIAGSSGFADVQYSGNGVLKTFGLPQNPGSAENLEVFISGVRQTPAYDYTLSGTTVTFIVAPPAGSLNVYFRWGTTLGIGVPADGSVTTNKIADANVTAAKLASNSVQSVKIVDEAVTLAKMQHIASSRILGRATAGSGDVEELSATGGLSVSAGAISGQLNFQTNRPQPQSPSVSAIDFIDIPSWVRRITVLFNGLSTNALSGGGNVEIGIRIGDAGGLELSAYDSMVYDSGGVTGWGGGFLVTGALLADSIVKGSVILVNITGNTWVASGVVGYSPTNSKVGTIVGTKTLSDVLTQLRVTTVGGTDAFDAGSVNILYE